MGSRLKRAGMNIDLAKRIIVDLTILNTNTNGSLSFSKLTPEFIHVPLYYARILFSFSNIHYMENINDKQLDMSVNSRHNQTSADFKVNIVPYKYQEHLLEEAKQQLNQKGTVLINAYTSFGKSVVLLHLIKYTKSVTLILLTRDTFLTQIGTIMHLNSTAKIWIPGIKKKGCLSCVSKQPPEEVDVIICMMRRINYIPQKLLDSVGTLVIDEAHLACTPTCVDPILSSRPKYIILLTATPTREDGMHKMLNLLSGPYQIIRQMEKPITVIRWSTGIYIPVVTGSRGKADWTAHLGYLANNKERNLLIKQLIYNIIHPSGKNSKIYKLLSKHSAEAKHKILGMTWLAESHRESIINTFNSDNEELDAGDGDVQISVDYLDASKNSYKDCDFLIGTFGKVGVGFDQQLFCENFDGVRIDIAIMLASTKAYNVLKQARGRACRSETPIFIYMVDDNPISYNHWNICRKYLLEESGTIIVHYRGEN